MNHDNNSQPHSTEKTQKMADVIAVIDLELMADGYRRRLLILDSQIAAFRKEREALTKERNALRAEREQLAALYKINMRVLNIVNAPTEAGEKKWQEGKKGSDRYRMLDGFAKSGS